MSEMDEFEYVLKIPKDRVGVIIGQNGKTKENIEFETKTHITVTKEGEVTIKGNSFESWLAKQIIKAIGRGFSPAKALLLLNDNYGFELIEMKNWAKTENSMKRLKGRVIGENGRSKSEIERITDSKISVYGKTIAVIGKTKKLLMAKKAIEMLLSGSRHSTVFSMLEKENIKLEKEEILGG